jgi:hypothetical protein
MPEVGLRAQITPSSWGPAALPSYQAQEFSMGAPATLGEVLVRQAHDEPAEVGRDRPPTATRRVRLPRR